MGTGIECNIWMFSTWQILYARRQAFTCKEYKKQKQTKGPVVDRYIWEYTGISFHGHTVA